MTATRGRAARVQEPGLGRKCMENKTLFDQRGVRRAALDLGSNLVRVAIGQLLADGSPHVFHKAVRVARVAEGLGGAGGRLGPDPVARATQAIQELDEVAADHGARIAAGVATGALRLAQNRDEVVARIRAETGVPLTVIDGPREARLSLRGVQSQVGDGPLLLVDIGGTTTEVAFVDAAGRVEAASHDIGVITLTEWSVRRGASDRAMRERAAAVLREVSRGDLPGSVPCFAAGGAAVALTAWRRRTSFLDYLGDADDVLDPVSRASIYGEFLAASPVARAERLQVSVEHAALVPAGYAILDAVLERLGVRDVAPTGRGVVEGLLAEILAAPPGARADVAAR